MIIVLPVINLFLYNALVSYIDWLCTDAIKAMSFIARYWPSLDFWKRVPIIRCLLSYLFDYRRRLQEFTDSLWNANAYMNSLALLPTFFENGLLSMLFGIILMWNICVFQRLLCFSLRVIFMMWSSNMGFGYYFLLVCFGVLMNSIHFGLIYGTLKLPHVQGILYD